MTYRLGPKGQVVIPKEFRDELNLEPGDEVAFWREGDHLALRPLSTRRPLRGRFAGMNLVSALERSRRDDRLRDDSA